jgi:hypothetical protein
MNKEIVIYRHKINKNIYLIRNWYVCGGSPDSDWFKATNDIYEAIENSENRDGKTIEEAYNIRAFPDELKAKIIVDKEFEFDGYKGILKKELVFKVSDFEKVTLIIKEDLVEKVESDE